MASRNGLAPMAKRHRFPPIVATANVCVRNSDNSIMGCSVCLACQQYRMPQASPPPTSITRSEEDTPELQSPMGPPYGVSCCKKNKPPSYTTIQTTKFSDNTDVKT